MAPRASVIKTRAPMTHDPLADHFARGRIDMAQFRAGREFQKHFAIADNSGRTNLADDQLAAWKTLARCYRALGANGSALVNDVLVNARTTRQIAESRSKTGQDWERYYVRRLRECLGTLAEVYGFSNEVLTKLPSPAPAPP